MRIFVEGQFEIPDLERGDEKNHLDAKSIGTGPLKYRDKPAYDSVILRELSFAEHNPGAIGSAFHGTGAEIGQKRHLAGHYI